MGMAIVLLFQAIPVSAEVTDNLDSAVQRILGTLTDTTTEEDYQSATLSAKLNYLEEENDELKDSMADLKIRMNMIVNTDISNALVTWDSDYRLSVVQLNGNGLTEGKDYTITYSTSTPSATGMTVTAKVTGLSPYEGTKTVTKTWPCYSFAVSSTTYTGTSSSCTTCGHSEIATVSYRWSTGAYSGSDSFNVSQYASVVTKGYYVPSGASVTYSVSMSHSASGADNFTSIYIMGSAGDVQNGGNSLDLTYVESGYCNFINKSFRMTADHTVKHYFRQSEHECRRAPQMAGGGMVHRYTVYTYTESDF